jgi:hypothetical protein
MFKSIIEKIKKVDSKIVKQFIYLVIIVIVYGILGMVNFSTVKFEVARLADKDFWVNYAIIIGFAIVIMSLSIAMKKSSALAKPYITDIQDELVGLKNAMLINGIYDDFGDNYLRNINTQRKISAYRESLAANKEHALAKVGRFKKDKYKKKWRSRMELYDAQLKATYEKDFDINNYSVDIREITQNTIFSGFTSKKESGTVFYSGHENLFNWVLPTVVVGVMIAGIMLSVMMNFHASTAEQWKGLLTTLWVSLSYLIIGNTYGDYSINTVYFSVLNTRKSYARAFLKTKGLVATVVDTTKVQVELKEVGNGNVQH